MTGPQLLALLAFLTVVGGLALMFAAIRGWAPPRPVVPGGHQWSARSWRWLLAALVGVVVVGLTAWPVLGLAAAAAVLGLPTVLGRDSSASRQIDRVEALEEWARRVADVLAIGVGLEQAIQSAARTAPRPIAGEVAVLSARISARTPTEWALRRFADDLDDPTADLIVAALVLAARRRGPGVAAALTTIADAAGEEVAARRRIEADRAKPRTTARAVTAISVTIMVLGLMNRGYTDPYATALGQVVLGATLGLFAVSLWWMRSMTRGTQSARILAPGVAG